MSEMFVVHSSQGAGKHGALGVSMLVRLVTRTVPFSLNGIAQAVGPSAAAGLQPIKTALPIIFTSTAGANQVLVGNAVLAKVIKLAHSRLEEIPVRREKKVIDAQ